MKIKRLLTLSVFTVIGWLGLSGVVKLSQIYSAQRQALDQAPKVLLAAETGSQAGNLDELKAKQKQLQDTIAVLETVPNLPGLDYSTAQVDLGKLRSLATALTQQLQVETQSNDNLQTALKLDNEATSLIQKPPLPAAVWQQAQDKWNQAIALLEKIPANTFVSTQAKEGLASTRANQKLVSQNLSDEERAGQKMSTAFALADQAMKQTQGTTYRLEDLINARANWYKAVQLLIEIPHSTTVAVNAGGMLETFQRNFQEIDTALNQFKACLGRNLSKDLCQSETHVAIEAPVLRDAALEQTEPSNQTTPDSEPEAVASGLDENNAGSGTGVGAGAGSTWVRGYTRRDGTSVRGHYRGGGRSSGLGHGRSGGSSS